MGPEHIDGCCLLRLVSANMFHDDPAKVALPSVRGVMQCIEGLAYIATISHPSGRSMFAFQSTAALGVARISEDGSLDSSNAVQEGL